MEASGKSRVGDSRETDVRGIDWFLRPEKEHRIHPFWFWNGDLRDEELIRQIGLMASQGVGGFFICARQGLDIPYLSEEWFRKVRVALGAARKENLGVWLYDEYPYPSGAAGGEVALLHPEATHRSLEHFFFRIRGGEVCKHKLGWERILYAKAVPLGQGGEKRQWSNAVDLMRHIGSVQSRNVFQPVGLTAYNRKRFFTADPSKWLQWQAPAGEWELHFFVEREVKNFKYFGTFIDPCNEAAVSAFIRLTHERYVQEVGGYFGNTIKGIFTDETGFLGARPWTPSLPQYFQERNGYDLCQRLHELVCSQSEICRRTRYDYFQSLHELLRDRYHKPLREWCDKHGLQYVAEAPSMRATTQIYSHIPAADNGHEKIGLPLSDVLDKCLHNIRYNPKMASSLASQLERPRSLVECFHSVGWSMTLKDAKWMIDRLVALGIDFFNFHAFCYSTDGLRKYDAPPSLFFQNPYWGDFHLLADYAARISAIADRATPDVEIAVVDATTSLWTRMGNPMESFSHHGPDVEEGRELDQLKTDWNAVCKTLLLGYRDYEHLDPELLSGAAVCGSVLHLGNSRFKALILPPLTNLERSAWEKIHEFVRAGGLVISYGLLPSENIEEEALPSEEIREVFGVGEDATTSYWEAGTAEPSAPRKGSRRAFFIPPCRRAPSADVPWLMALLEENLKPSIRFQPDKAMQSFLLRRWRGEEGSDLLFVTNQGGTGCQARLDVGRRAGVSQRVEAFLWNLETGRRDSLSVDDGNIILRFEPFQARLVEVSIKADAAEEKPPSPGLPAPGISRVLTLGPEDPWDVELADDNVVRLQKFDFVAQGEMQGRLLEARPFINLCQEAGTSLPLRYHQNFGAPVRASIAYPVDCRFLTRFEIVELPSKCRLVLEEEAISGNFCISVNGKTIQPVDFRYEAWLGQPKATCEIGALLKPGENHCLVRISVDDDSQGVADSLFLRGRFGVGFNRKGLPVMNPLPRRLRPFVHPYPEFPFYAGTLLFKRVFARSEIEGCEFVQLSDGGGLRFNHVAELFLNGVSLGIRAWDPYRWRTGSSILREDENVFEMRIVTGLEGLFEGRYFDYTTHCLHDFPEGTTPTCRG